MKKTLIVLLLLTGIALPAFSAGDTATGDTTNSLPEVLIIGDSISMGYTPFVKQIMKDKAIVKHNKGNAEYTGCGPQALDRWIGETKWDVIHFNWGLWDIYGWRYAKIDRSPATYEKRLDKLVTRLEKTGAKLIWATTTPVCPAPEQTMLKKFNTVAKITPSAEKEYLDAALRVMNKHHVEVNDLHALIAPQRNKYALSADNVHYTKKGYEKLAKQVAESIEKNLDK